MALLVLLDAVAEIAQAPLLGLGDLAALAFDDLAELRNHGFDLCGRNILARDEYVLVERHRQLSFWLLRPDDGTPCAGGSDLAGPADGNPARRSEEHTAEPPS